MTESIAIYFPSYQLATLCSKSLHYFMASADTYSSRGNDCDNCCGIAKQSHQPYVTQQVVCLLCSQATATWFLGGVCASICTNAASLTSSKN